MQKESDVTKRERNKIEILYQIENLAQKKYKTHFVTQKSFFKNPSFGFNIYITNERKLINQKIEKNTIPLGEICRYIIPGINSLKKYIYTQKINEKCKKFVDGGNISRFKINYCNEYILYDKKILVRARSEEIFLSKKIILQRVSGGNKPLIAAVDNNQYYTFASTNNIVIIKDNQFSY